ncbi:hypothetical protein F2Q70_00038964 [Brassica cretica]|uniref:Uncharacterized protein n=1 Tax=Brassica cretica TaxID=69181 RepID=A0A8S9K275_BRACR|nr:hypothetical protein F2Q70_00038964 [Brassica cretica]
MIEETIDGLGRRAIKTNTHERSKKLNREHNQEKRSLEHRNQKIGDEKNEQLAIGSTHRSSIEAREP